MKLVIQRVTQAKVTVNNKIIGQIKKGYLVLVGFKVEDTSEKITEMAKKLINLRIMADKDKRMNLSLADTQGELLLVSQFTLYADTSSRRPGFTKAAKPDIANKFFQQFVKECQKSNLKVETGKFGAYMQVVLNNDGPVTIILEN